MGIIRADTHIYLTFRGKFKGQRQFFLAGNVLYYVKLPEKAIYSKIITARAAVFDLRGVKGQGQNFFCLEMDFFFVKLPEKMIYAKIITARAAFFYLCGVKGQGQYFFWLEMDFFM